MKCQTHKWHTLFNYLYVRNFFNSRFLCIASLGAFSLDSTVRAAIQILRTHHNCWRQRKNTVVAHAFISSRADAHYDNKSHFYPLPCRYHLFSFKFVRFFVCICFHLNFYVEMQLYCVVHVFAAGNHIHNALCIRMEMQTQKGEHSTFSVYFSRNLIIPSKLFLLLF